jgi:hypothetical protein
MDVALTLFQLSPNQKRILLLVALTFAALC